MNDIAAVAGHPAPATADCFHCGDPLPATPVALRLDGALREIFGEATVPFAVRHPYIRGIDYTKKRR